MKLKVTLTKKDIEGMKQMRNEGRSYREITAKYRVNFYRAKQAVEGTDTPQPAGSETVNSRAFFNWKIYFKVCPLGM